MILPLSRAEAVCEFVKMSKGQTLRALVNERLAAAAEDIFVLFERTLVEYEEELCRSREENQRKQQLLDTVLISRADTIRGNMQITSSPGLSLEVPEIPVKEESEEESFKQEDELLPVPVPEVAAVCVTTEESQDISSEPHFHSETDNDGWGPLLSYSAAQMETEAGGDHYNQVQIRDRSFTLSPQNQPAPETIVYSEDMTEADGAQRKKHQCQFCHKCFQGKGKLEIHIRVHTGERPYSCSICEKTFTQKGHLDLHIRTHTGERPYSCSICNKTFIQKSSLDTHNRTHTGEKPFSCSTCGKKYAYKHVLELHKRKHTGDKPLPSQTCQKTFAQKSNLELHQRQHTVEKPFCCSVCNKTFAQKSVLHKHMRTHTQENPFSCPVCGKTFAQQSSLKSHMSSHTLSYNHEEGVWDYLPPKAKDIGLSSGTVL